MSMEIWVSPYGSQWQAVICRENGDRELLGDFSTLAEAKAQALAHAELNDGFVLLDANISQ